MCGFPVGMKMHDPSAPKQIFWGSGQLRRDRTVRGVRDSRSTMSRMRTLSTYRTPRPVLCRGEMLHAEDIFEPFKHAGIVGSAKYGGLCSFDERLFERVRASRRGQLGCVGIDHACDDSRRDWKGD